jgi:hypothetical protein
MRDPDLRGGSGGGKRSAKIEEERLMVRKVEETEGNLWRRGRADHPYALYYPASPEQGTEIRGLGSGVHVSGDLVSVAPRERPPMLISPSIIQEGGTMTVRTGDTGRLCSSEDGDAYRGQLLVAEVAEQSTIPGHQETIMAERV